MDMFWTNMGNPVNTERNIWMYTHNQYIFHSMVFKLMLNIPTRNDQLEESIKYLFDSNGIFTSTLSFPHMHQW